MKVIKVPEDVVVAVPQVNGKMVRYVDETHSIFKFLQECIDVFEQFSKGHVNALLYVKLTKILSETDRAKGDIWFEDGDFKKLQEAVGAVAWISPKMNASYIPFYEAVSSARAEAMSQEKKV